MAKVCSLRQTCVGSSKALEDLSRVDPYRGVPGDL